MRGYETYAYQMIQEYDHSKNIYKDKGMGLEQYACWSHINSYLKKDLLIGNFDDPTTRKYQEILIEIINKITPCEIIKIDKFNLIKIQLLSTYDQSLILLNFIRYLWCDYGKFDYLLFFDFLENDKLYDEPLEKLTFANALASVYNNYSGDHSNKVVPKLAKIKNTEQLLSYKGNSTQQFLTKY